MDRVLDNFGFKKDGLYSWVLDNYHIVLYFDGISIIKIDDDKEITLYDGIIPTSEHDKIKMIEKYTNMKIVNQKILKILNSTKNERMFRNTTLNVSKILINYIKYNNYNDDDICNQLDIDYISLKSYLTGTHDFKLSEMVNISTLVNKNITIKL